MKWSRERPKKEGWYWIRRQRRGDLATTESRAGIVRVLRMEMLRYGPFGARLVSGIAVEEAGSEITDALSDDRWKGFEWYGPLPEPEA